MILRALALLALLAAPAALACVSSACSNDPRVLGDERLAWDASETAVSYQVCTDDEVACIETTGTDLLVSGTSLLARNDTALLKIRACNEVGCSAWSGTVEFLPYICIEGDREVPCFPGATLRLPRSA